MNVVLDGTSLSSCQITWVGATTPELLKNQISSIEKDSDIVILQIGGNDIGLFDFINGCIIKFLPQAPVSRNKITNSFPVPMDSYIHAVQEQIDNAIFNVYVIGYTYIYKPTRCKDVSFDFWRDLPENQGELTSALLPPGTVLRQISTLRASMPSIAPARRIKGQSMVFLNWVSAFEGHRYCDVGFDEPDLTHKKRTFQDNILFSGTVVRQYWSSTIP